jgi:hypothetical protein
MEEPASRREFLRNVTALGAASSVSVGLAADGSAAQQFLAQAQPAVPATSRPIVRAVYRASSR